MVCLNFRMICALALSTAPFFAYALESDKIYEKVSRSVWTVRTFDDQERRLALGSAVVIGRGKLITNCHVLEKAKEFNIQRDNITYGAKLEFADKARDLCQIKVANFDAPSVEIAAVKNLKIGQKVYAIGNPRGLEQTMSDGIISSLRRDEEDSAPYIQTTAPISPGSSGGGLFDSDGKLIGITTFQFKAGQNLNFAAPASWIFEIAERHNALVSAKSAARENAANGRRPNLVTGDYSGPLLIGETWQYAVTEQLTKLKREVTYRIDKIDGNAGQITFNGGSRVEGIDGKVIKINSFESGEFDSGAPPGGWLDFPLTPGKIWTASYAAQDINKSAYKLTAKVMEEEKIRVPAGEFLTTKIVWKGYVTRLARGTSARGPYTATVWYCAEINHIVKFAINYTNTYRDLNVNESMELTRHTVD